MAPHVLGWHQKTIARCLQSTSCSWEGGLGCPRRSRLATMYRSCLSQFSASTCSLLQNLNATVINRSSNHVFLVPEKDRHQSALLLLLSHYRKTRPGVGVFPNGRYGLVASSFWESPSAPRYLTATWVLGRLHLSEISMHETVRQAERENIPESPKMMRFPWNIRITVVGNAALVWVPQRSPAHGPRRVARHSTESTG